MRRREFITLLGGAAAVADSRSRAAYAVGTGHWPCFERGKSGRSREFSNKWPNSATRLSRTSNSSSALRQAALGLNMPSTLLARAHEVIE
jgi:hypothetical protein